MVNRWIGIGNLGADPELRTTAGGQSVSTIRLACNEKFKDKSGQMQERTEWVTCVLWGKDAENVHKFCKKGKQLYIEGRLQTRSWEQDGQKRYATEVVVETVKFLGGGRGEEGAAGGEGRGGYGRGSGGGRQQQEEAAPYAPDEEIPF